MIQVKRWTMGWGLALLAVAAVGCGSGEKAAESATERMIESAANAQGQDVEVDFDGDKTTFSVKTDEGTVAMNAGDNVALPEDMPDDVPVIAGFKANMVQSLGAQGAFNLMGTVSQPPAEVTAFYEKELGAQGWEEVTRFSDADGSANLSFKKESRMVNLSVVPDDAGAMLTLTHVQQ